MLILDVKTKRLLLRRFESDKINQTFDLALRALSEFKQAKRQHLFERGCLLKLSLYWRNLKLKKSELFSV